MMYINLNVIYEPEAYSQDVKMYRKKQGIKTERED